jgi:hypothetical protein
MSDTRTVSENVRNILINVRTLFVKTWVCYKNVRMARNVEASGDTSLSLKPRSQSPK